MNNTNQQTTTELSNCRLYRVGGCPYFDFYNADCMEIMKQYPDNHFDLAIVDPPYGVDIGEKAKSFSAKKFTKGNEWDKKIPESDYFNELMRISISQIIWGGNYFLDYLGATKCMIVWDKYNTNKGRFADGEIAWTSFNKPTRIATYEWLMWYQPDMKNRQERIHPTQKPEQLYDWLIKEYADVGQKILDTHLGSASIAIAVHKANTLDKMNLHLTGIEIDADYFQAAMNRIKKHVAQGTFSF